MSDAHLNDLFAALITLLDEVRHALQRREAQLQREAAERDRAALEASTEDGMSDAGAFASW